jgi:hypothetical protein
MLDRLWETLLKNSESKVLQNAILEWDLEEVEDCDEWSNCECGHDIKERCIIKNKVNNKRLVVGNCCINHFDKELSKLSRSLLHKKINLKIIEKAKQDGVLSLWEKEFLCSVYRKRKLTERQVIKLKQVKNKIFKAYCRGSKNGV